MSWSQLTFVVDAAEVERLSTILETLLAQAVTTENAGEDEFYEVAFPGTPDWQKVRVSALFAKEVELDPIIDFVVKLLGDEQKSEIPISITELVDQDWERVWLKSFKPIQVGHDLWVCPSWCDPVKPDQRNIIIDPGLAFGTGTHATTAMCLNWLARQNLEQQSVLDYGSGSGILAIAALLSGASSADAVDIDPLAVAACRNNAQANQVGDHLFACSPSQLAPDKTYDLVIANILADVLIELRDTLLLHLASGGTLLLTGILDSQASKVKRAFKDLGDFQVITQDQWCLLVNT